MGRVCFRELPQASSPLATCCRLNIVPQEFNVGALIPSSIAFGGGPFEVTGFG